MKLLPLPCKRLAFAWLGSQRKMAVPSPIGDVKIVSPISTIVLNTLFQTVAGIYCWEHHLKKSTGRVEHSTSTIIISNSFRKHSFLMSTGTLCNRPMGMQTGRIKNNKITSSSEWDRYHAPFLARLHRRRRGRYMGAWSAKYNNYYQWLQVDFGKAAKIIKMSTQGRQDLKQWVTQYYVTRSLDALHFVPYKERNNIKVWKAFIN